MGKDVMLFLGKGMLEMKGFHYDGLKRKKENNQ